MNSAPLLAYEHPGAKTVFPIGDPGERLFRRFAAIFLRTGVCIITCMSEFRTTDMRIA
jgi:hypothetical protein